MTGATEPMGHVDPKPRGFGGGSGMKPFEAGIRGAALVIANWDYPGRSRLNGPKLDLPLLETGFRANRFHVTCVANVKRPEHLLDEVAGFVDRVLKSREPQHGGFCGPVLVYYAGHGAKSPADERNYILPVNTDLDRFWSDPHSATCLDEIARELHRLKGCSVALILDACRDMPSATRGASVPALPHFGRVTHDRLDEMRRGSDGGPSWLGLIFSTQPGQAAADTMAGPNSVSPFAHAFVRCLRALPWHLRSRRLDEFFSRDVKKIFNRVDKRGQTIAISQAGEIAAPVIGGHIGRWIATVGGAGVVLLCAATAAVVWVTHEPILPPSPAATDGRVPAIPPPAPTLGSTTQPGKGEPPDMTVAPGAPTSTQTEAAPPAPSERSSAEQRLQGRLRLAAAQEADRKGEPPIAAGLALAALDLPGFSEDDALRAEAAKLLYRSQLAIGKPDTGFTIPGIPTEEGQFELLSAFSDDGARFAVQAGQDPIRVYDTATGVLQATVEAPPQVTELRLSPDGTMLLLLGEEQMTFHAFDGAEPQRWTIPLAGDPVRNGWPRLSPDGKRMADTLDPKKIVIRETRTGEGAAPAIAVRARAYRPEFSPDGRFLSAAIPGVGVIVWDSVSGREWMRHPLKNEEMASAEFSRDGKYLLATEDTTGAIAVLDMKARKELKLRSKPAARAGSRSFLLNAESDIATLETDGTLVVWNPIRDKELTRFSAGKEEFYQVAVLQGGEVLALGTAGNHLLVWRWRDREKLLDRRATWQQAVGFSVSRSGDALHVVEKGKLMTLQVIGNGEAPRIPAFDTDAAQFAVSPDKRRFAASSSQGTRLWDTPSGRLIKDTGTGRKLDDALASALAFSPDSTKLFVASPQESGGPIAVLSARDGQQLPELSDVRQPRTPVTMLQPSGAIATLLYSVSYHEFQMWDTDDRALVRSHAFDTKGRGSIFERTNADRTVDVFAITVNPVSQVLSEVDVVNGTKPEDRKWMKGHTAYILGTRFSHSGKQVVSFSQDKTVRVWDAASGKALAERRIAEGIRDIAMSTDDAEIRILTEDAALKRWRWLDDKINEGAHINDCDKGRLEGSLLLCRSDLDTYNTPAVLHAIRDDGGMDIIARFAGDAELIDDGRYVLESGETATLSPTFASLDAMKTAARARLEPYRETIEAALAALR